MNENGEGRSILKKFGLKERREIEMKLMEM